MGRVRGDDADRVRLRVPIRVDDALVKLLGYRRQRADLEPLMEEIENKGTCVMFPALFARPDGTYTVLAGERRVLALRELGFGLIPAHEIRTWPEFATWLRRDQQAAQELRSPGLYMNPIEAGLWANQIRELLVPRKNDWPDQRLSGYLALGLEQLRDGRYLVGKYLNHDLPEVREAAEEAVRQVLAGEISASTATKSCGKVERAIITRPATASLGPLGQRKAISNAVHQTAGIVAGLDALGVLSEHLTADERKEWAVGLRKARAALDRFVKALEGRA